MVFPEAFNALFERFHLVHADLGNACPQSFPAASASFEGDGRNAIVKQFMCQFRPCHAGIHDGEVESVCHRFVAVLVIYHLEAGIRVQFLHGFGAQPIFPDVRKDVEGALVGSFQDGCNCVLRGMGCAGSEGVNQFVGQRLA